MPSPERYFANPVTVQWRQWDDEMVAYNNQQASTHLLAAGPAAALKVLLAARRGCTIDELRQQLTLECAGSEVVDASGHERESLEFIVAELTRSGLIQSRCR